MDVKAANQMKTRRESKKVNLSTVSDSDTTAVPAIVDPLLVGLLLNAIFGLWWADPVTALIMVPIIAKEGIESVQGKACDDCTSA
jgi:divalent metal cation (Fe/Co/Zn/Cd) transporter